MEKSREAFRTISEVAEWLKTPAHVLRFWESRFPEVRPIKRAGGRRYYRPADMALLAGIKKLLHDEGMTIRGVQKILSEQGVKFVAGLADVPSDDVFGSPALHGELWGVSGSPEDEAPMILDAEDDRTPRGPAKIVVLPNRAPVEPPAAESPAEPEPQDDPQQDNAQPAEPQQKTAKRDGGVPERLAVRLRRHHGHPVQDVARLRALHDRLAALRDRLAT